MFFKGTVNIISSEPPCTEGNTRFTTVHFILKPLTVHRKEIFLFTHIETSLNSSRTLLYAVYSLNSSKLKQLVWTLRNLKVYRLLYRASHIIFGLSPRFDAEKHCKFFYKNYTIFCNDSYFLNFLIIPEDRNLEP